MLFNLLTASIFTEIVRKIMLLHLNVIFGLRQNIRTTVQVVVANKIINAKCQVTGSCNLPAARSENFEIYEIYEIF